METARDQVEGHYGRGDILNSILRGSHDCSPSSPRAPRVRRASGDGALLRATVHIGGRESDA
jgi:hypothetical protein